jgi:hypothetical protein
LPSGKRTKRLPKSGLEEDALVAEQARAQLGGNAKLADYAGVDESAASRWGRTRRIPRHLRDKLAALTATAIAPAPKATPNVAGDKHFTEAVRRLHRIWNRRATRQGASAWMAIQQNLVAFADYADPGQTPEPARRIAPTPNASKAQAQGGKSTAPGRDIQ